MERRPWLRMSSVVFIAMLSAACSGGAGDQHVNNAPSTPQSQPTAQPEHVWSSQVQAWRRPRASRAL